MALEVAIHLTAETSSYLQLMCLHKALLEQSIFIQLMKYSCPCVERDV